MSEQEKVLFSWRVLKGEDGGIRTEGYIDPDWQEHGWGSWGPFGRHHRHRRARAFGPMPFGPHMFGGQGARRKRAREMLDWLERMYDEFYGESGADEPAEA